MDSEERGWKIEQGKDSGLLDLISVIHKSWNSWQQGRKSSGNCGIIWSGGQSGGRITGWSDRSSVARYAILFPLFCLLKGGSCICRFSWEVGFLLVEGMGGNLVHGKIVTRDIGKDIWIEQGGCKGCDFK